MRPQMMQAFLVPASYGDSFNEPSHRFLVVPFIFVAFAMYYLPLINETNLISCHILQFDPADTGQARHRKFPFI
jgi:hypothetical protein